MMDYSLDNHLKEIYAHYPEGKRKPVIGITANHSDVDTTVRDRYEQQIVKAGGVPVIIPPVSDVDVIIETLERIDALLLTGGADHDPRWMGEEPSPLLGNVNEVRDLPELLITRLAYNRQLPMMGICRGMQTMAVALKGHVAQDISEVIKTDIAHSQKEEREVKTHNVKVVEDSIIANIYSSVLTLTPSLPVNSFHHQAVDDCGELFHAVAWAEDGVIEAMESSEHKPMMGVQWHPEWLGDDGQPLFRWLVEEASTFMKAKDMHKRCIILDSHCDTPMFFPQGADFSKRDDKILVDVHKMRDGMQDAVTMVAYIPQPSAQQTWAEVAPFETESPKAYADLIFDKIEDIVLAHTDIMGIAHNREELLANKAAGRKSIMLGIENALAIGDDLGNVKHFADRGAVYFTLCHNGDNQVCDSARRSENTWGGVSPFGERLIEEMNRQGVTVDLSHAGERSFYDAVEMSNKPVVCSHSNCKALCNHERNLTDDQLRTLAKKNGVCQVTLYEGFVSENPSEADIRKAIEHLNHAVDIMGIDHVGLGSDFDGDGGICGIKDSSEMLNFTRHLLRQRYSDEDIEKIWGGNWLRALGR